MSALGVVPRDLVWILFLAVLRLITLNQQIVRPEAVIAQQWEYYVYYIALMGAGAGPLVHAALDDGARGQASGSVGAAFACWKSLF